MGMISKTGTILVVMICLFITKIGATKNDAVLKNGIKLLEEQKYNEAKKNI